MKRRQFIRALTPLASVTLPPFIAACAGSASPPPSASRPSHLFLSDDDVARISSQLTGALQFLATPFLKIVAHAISKDPVATYPATSDVRPLGDSTADIAFAWLVTRDTSYLAPLQAYVAQSIAILGPIPAADQGNQLLDYGSLLLGLAMAYDYAGDALPDGVADQVAAAMTAAATELNAYLAATALPYLFNHTQVPTGGLVAAAMALQAVEPAATGWLETARGVLGHAVTLLSGDGSSREGPGYSEYYLEWFLKSGVLFRQRGEGRFLQTPWIAAYPKWRIYQGLPANSWNAAVTISTTQDGAEHDYDGPDYLFRFIAAEYGDGVAQSYAQLSDAVVPASGTTYARPVSNPAASWLNLVWYDIGVAAVSHTTWPTLKNFDDIGLVSARSDWSGDESLLMFKCGAAGSASAQTQHASLLQAGDFGHSHANSGHVSFFAHGQWVLPNAGYIQRISANENTLLIDGKGQYDSKGFFDGWAQSLAQGTAGPMQHIVSATPGADVDIVVGDATAAYDASLGLTQFVRTVVYLKPDVVLVLDRIATTTSRRLDLGFHFQDTPALQPDGSYLAAGSRCTAAFTLLRPGPTMAVTQQTQRLRFAGGKQVVPLLTVSGQGAALTCAVALSTCAAGSTPQAVTVVSSSATAMVIAAAGKQVSWDTTTGAVSVSS